MSDDPLNIKDRIINYIKLKDIEQAKQHKSLAQNEFYFTQASTCSRELYYSKLGFHKKYSPVTNTIFLVGNLLHDFMQKEILTDFESEVSIRYNVDNIILRGRADAVNDEYVIELKSWTGMKEIAEIKHILQLNMALHKHQDKKGILIYIDKRTFGLSIHIFDFNQNYFDSVINKFKQIVKCLQEKKVPELPKHREKCRRCYYKDRCQNG